MCLCRGMQAVKTTADIRISVIRLQKEFREELYEGIMKAYEQVQQIEENRLQLKISQVDQEKSQELKFNVKVTPFERDGSNIRGLARIYLEDCFVINNVSLLQGKNGLFVAMPSYKTKQTDEQGKSIYQDICFPVTKEFREKLYGAVRKSFEESRKKQKSGDGKEQTEPSAGRDGWQEAKDTPFR